MIETRAYALLQWRRAEAAEPRERRRAGATRRSRRPPIASGSGTRRRGTAQSRHRLRGRRPPPQGVLDLGCCGCSIAPTQRNSDVCVQRNEFGLNPKYALKHTLHATPCSLQDVQPLKECMFEAANRGFGGAGPARPLSIPPAPRPQDAQPHGGILRAGSGAAVPAVLSPTGFTGTPRTAMRAHRLGNASRAQVAATACKLDHRLCKPGRAQPRREQMHRAGPQQCGEHKTTEAAKAGCGTALQVA